MQKRILSLLVLLVTAVTGAWADQTYNVTFSGFSSDALNTTVNNVTLPRDFNFNAWDVLRSDVEVFTEVYVSSGGEGKVNVSVDDPEEVMKITITGAFTGTATIHCKGLYSNQDQEQELFEGDIYVTCVAAGSSAVASIGETNYTTLQAAFTAAETGQTIKLLSDVTQAGGVGKHDGKAVTFDLNGHIYTCTDDYGVMATDNSQITIIDSSTGTPGGIKSGFALVGQENGKIIIKAGRYNIDNLSVEELLEAFPYWGVEMYSGYTLQDITPADAQGFCVGVVAPTPVAYTVALKDGTEDATNWTIAPPEATTSGVPENTTVTVGYTGTHRVKSVKAKKKAAAELGHALSASVVGELVGSDGKAYAVADKDKLPQGVTAVAMVAYRSETVGSSLAIQLNASPVSKSWSEAKTYAEGLTAVSGGTWCLPSKTDWQNMFVGCAVSGDADASDSMEPIAGFKAKIAATGTEWQSGIYWSSTDSGSNASLVYVPLDGSFASANFGESGTSNPYRVLGCLAF